MSELKQTKKLSYQDGNIDLIEEKEFNRLPPIDYIERLNKIDTYLVKEVFNLTKEEQANQLTLSKEKIKIDNKTLFYKYFIVFILIVGFVVCYLYSPENIKNIFGGSIVTLIITSILTPIIKAIFNFFYRNKNK